MGGNRDSILSVLKSWVFWVTLFGLILGVFSLNFFKIDLPTITIPVEYLVIIFQLLLSLFFLFNWVDVSRKNKELENGLRETSNELQTIQSEGFPGYFIEDVFLSTLLQSELIRDKKEKNPVALEVYENECRVVGDGERKDAEIRYYFKGKNLDSKNLLELYFIIAGDNFIKLEDLKAFIFDLKNDPERSNRRLPKLLGADGELKKIVIPFGYPGIEPNEDFEIEFGYRWPEVFSKVKSYWHLNHWSFTGPTKSMRLIMEFNGSAPKSMSLHSKEFQDTQIAHLGELLPDTNNAKRYTFQTSNPNKEISYIFFFKGTEA